MSDPRSSLPQRYAAPSAGSRVVVLMLAGVVIAAFLGWIVWAIAFHSDPAVASEEIGHEILDDHTARIHVQLKYGDGPVEAECKLRAIAADKNMVGELTVHPDPAVGPSYDFTIATERRATTVEWLGCKTEGQPRYR